MTDLLSMYDGSGATRVQCVSRQIQDAPLFIPLIVMPSHATPMNPKKLLHSKWTAVTPRNKEKHFLVTGIVEPEAPGSPVVSIELEAVHSRNVRVMPWRELTDVTQWKQGWV